MAIRGIEKAHGAAILNIFEALGRELPGKYFSLETGDSRSAYLITGFDSESNLAVQCGIFVKVASARRSPWRFSFHKDHQDELKVFKDNCGEAFSVFVNGDDGFAVLNFLEMKSILDEEHGEQEWVAISREPRQGYRASGNDGKLEKVIPQNNFPYVIFDYFKNEFSNQKRKTKRRKFSLLKFERFFRKS